MVSEMVSGTICKRIRAVALSLRYNRSCLSYAQNRPEYPHIRTVSGFLFTFLHNDVTLNGRRIDKNFYKIPVDKSIRISYTSIS